MDSLSIIDKLSTKRAGEGPKPINLELGTHRWGQQWYETFKIDLDNINKASGTFKIDLDNIKKKLQVLEDRADSRLRLHKVTH